MWKALILKLEFDKTMFMYEEKPFRDKDPQTSIFFLSQPPLSTLYILPEGTSQNVGEMNVNILTMELFDILKHW